ncbi:MAG: copper-binding protein [Pyrinomonadaceae bacterium]|nr:copper-binding protein [Pyrinomonadaceae bacterium]
MKFNKFLSVVYIGLIIGLLSACGNKSEPQASTFSSTGVITGISAEKKEITIDHKEIPGLMSAMEMDFPVKTTDLIKDLKVGNEVRFSVEKNGSDMVVTEITKTAEGSKVDGALIYKENCAKCHGPAGEGTEKGISFLKGHAIGHPEQDFIDQVKNGEEDKMPAFKEKLSEEEIAAVVKYVRNVIQKDVKDSGGSHKH